MERNGYKGYTRYVDAKGLCAYLSCGRNSAIEIGERYGAKVRITDKLIRYDLVVIDKAMQEIRTATDPESEVSADGKEL